MAVASLNLEAPIGRVDTTLTITNNVDQIRAEANEIDAAAVRSVVLEGVLVDTDATHLCLPADVIARLGLRPSREVNIRTATGTGRVRLFRDALLEVMGREDTFSCIELPVGTQPLLGVVPMEVLGLQPNVVTRRLELLPDGPNDTYITVL